MKYEDKFWQKQLDVAFPIFMVLLALLTIAVLSI